MKQMTLSIVLFLLAGAAGAAQQVINVGSSANDGTGDTLRAAMQKVNANDSELYTDITALEADIVALGTDISSLETSLAGKQPLDADLTAIAALSAANGDVIQRVGGAWTNSTAAQLKTSLSLTKTDVGLSNVDNTADAAKNVATAVALAANGTNCSSGEAARGVDASGNAEGCFTPGGSGDASTNTSTSVDSEVALFSGTGGKTLKRATGTGIATLASGVLGTVAAPSGAVVGTSDTQTLTNKTISGASNTLSNIDLATAVTGDLPDANLTANVPLLSAANTFTANQAISSTEPRFLWNESDQASDEKLWDLDIQGKVACLRTRTDADGAGVNVFCATRGTGTALSNITIGPATSYTFSGSGTTTFGGSIDATAGSGIFQRISMNPYSGGSPPSYGFYRDSSSQVIQRVNSTVTTISSSSNVATTVSTADQSYSLQTPTTGFSITIANNSSTLILKPAGTLATGTIIMPASPKDGQNVRFTTSQIITALTVSPNTGQSIVGAPTTLALGQGAAFIYSLSDTTWYRLYLGN